VLRTSAPLKGALDGPKTMSDSRRRFLTFASGLIAGIGGTLATFPLFRSFGIPGHVKPPQYGKTIDISNLKPGEIFAVSVAGRLLYVLKRTPEQIQSLRQPYSKLLDPLSKESAQPPFAANSYRSLKPEIFVAWGLCTHLGCAVTYSPAANPEINDRNLEQNGGFGCPCHYAKFDVAGRVYRNVPAPLNLEIPSYEFLDERTIRITDQKAI
jgi:ubiquinol-cytochrome c reductase iron-sulfur subunit